MRWGHQGSACAVILGPGVGDGGCGLETCKIVGCWQQKMWVEVVEGAVAQDNTGRGIRVKRVRSVARGISDSASLGQPICSAADRAGEFGRKEMGQHSTKGLSVCRLVCSR